MRKSWEWRKVAGMTGMAKFQTASGALSGFRRHLGFDGLKPALPLRPTIISASVPFICGNGKQTATAPPPPDKKTIRNASDRS
ncbi:hypothetical protein, partial [Neisseria polysaccharea]|uniref:hypothetical protein n=1 Tax=Neisseria polysaccharea TaxID=489 RepID=UPI00272D6552